LIGLAVISALVLGVASAAFGANGGNLILGQNNTASLLTKLTGQVPGGAALQVVNTRPEAGSRGLQLSVAANKPPIQVNATAGKAINLDADKLDGKDSKQLLPLVRAQKDPTPFLSDTVSGMSAQTNSVSIDAPTNGVLMVFGSMWLYNPGTEVQSFSARIRLDGQEEAHVDASNVPPSRSSGLSPSVTLPVSAGQHTVTLDAVQSGSTENWSYTSNNLSVMFVPQGQGEVINAAG
jgi:hypothetical protein